MFRSVKFPPNCDWQTGRMIVLKVPKRALRLPDSRLLEVSHSNRPIAGNGGGPRG